MLLFRCLCFECASERFHEGGVVCRILNSPLSPSLAAPSSLSSPIASSRDTERGSPLSSWSSFSSSAWCLFSRCRCEDDPFSNLLEFFDPDFGLFFHFDLFGIRLDNINDVRLRFRCFSPSRAQISLTCALRARRSFAGPQVCADGCICGFSLGELESNLLLAGAHCLTD